MQGLPGGYGEDMPLDERMLEQNDPNIDTIAALQRSITATLTYIMGRASVVELFGLQAILSQLASRMTPPEAGNQLEMPAILREQLAELERRSTQLRAVEPIPAPVDRTLEEELERRRQYALQNPALMHEFQNHLRGER
jgi:hypothetical protein